MPTSLIEVHEDRIQRLEDGVSECRVDIGGLTAKVDEGFAMISKKLDSFTKLDERVAAIETSERVNKEVGKRSKDRWKSVMKIASVVGAVLVGIGGIVAKIVFGN